MFWSAFLHQKVRERHHRLARTDVKHPKGRRASSVYWSLKSCSGHFWHLTAASAWRDKRTKKCQISALGFGDRVPSVQPTCSRPSDTRYHSASNYPPPPHWKQTVSTPWHPSPHPVPHSNPGGPTKYLIDLQTRKVSKTMVWSPTGVQNGRHDTPYLYVTADLFGSLLNILKILRIVAAARTVWRAHGDGRVLTRIEFAGRRSWRWRFPSRAREPRPSVGSTAAAPGFAGGGTIQRRLNAIAEAHKALGLDPPTSSGRVRNTLRGIRRSLGVAPATKAPALTDDIRAMIGVTDAGLIGLRDRALILLGFAGAFGRSAVVGLDMADLAFGKDGLTVTLRRSKTDQAGESRKIGVPYGSNPETCPVRVVQSWLEASGLAEGPVFLAIDRHGKLRPGRLCTRRCCEGRKEAGPSGGARSCRLCRSKPASWPRHERGYCWRFWAQHHESDRAQVGADGTAVYQGWQLISGEQRGEVGAVGTLVARQFIRRFHTLARDLSGAIYLKIIEFRHDHRRGASPPRTPSKFKPVGLTCWRALRLSNVRGKIQGDGASTAHLDHAFPSASCRQCLLLLQRRPAWATLRPLWSARLHNEKCRPVTQTLRHNRRDIGSPRASAPAPHPSRVSE